MARYNKRGAENRAAALTSVKYAATLLRADATSQPKGWSAVTSTQLFTPKVLHLIGWILGTYAFHSPSTVRRAIFVARGKCMLSSKVLDRWALRQGVGAVHFPPKQRW